jgi:putative transposase
MKVQRASHCVYQIRYHMVFCIKYRQRLLSVEERCEYLKQVLKDIAERYWFEMEKMGTDGDHVHLFVGSAPKYAPSRVMQILKSITARQMFIQRRPSRRSSYSQKSVNNYGAGNSGAMGVISERLEMA